MIGYSRVFAGDAIYNNNRVLAFLIFNYAFTFEGLFYSVETSEYSTVVSMTYDSYESTNTQRIFAASTLNGVYNKFKLTSF